MSSPSDFGASDSGASGFESEPMLGVADWTELPTDERRCLRWMLRTGEVTTLQTSEELGMDEEASRVVLEALVTRKLAVFIDEKIVYVGNVGRRTARFKPGGMWDALADKLIDD
ncbi:hypothetical protein IMCC26256_11341 [Actinobacteria bacterium IMCC26256]|nr:hypothetical protein IMCC26256_11341 [Actinobacteria bacterium IMCC26256]